MIDKKIYCIILAVTLAVGLCGCGKNNQPTETTDNHVAATMGAQYVAVFDDSDITDADMMADELLKQVKTPYELEKMNVEEGYLAGFDADITGFQKGVMFAPMISTIPFVAYVFETEDPDALLTLLKEKANPAWNICTEADETACSSRGNLVFFVMCRNED